MFFDVLLCRKECESITEAHVGIASLPFIKKDFDFIILLIFSVFFGGVRFLMPKQVRVKIVVILWAIYIAGDWGRHILTQILQNKQEGFPAGVLLS